MYYLYHESDNELVLAKSKDINLLLKTREDKNLIDWTIGNNPINYNEDDYISLDDSEGTKN